MDDLWETTRDTSPNTKLDPTAVLENEKGQSAILKRYGC